MHHHIKILLKHFNQEDKKLEEKATDLTDSAEENIISKFKDTIPNIEEKTKGIMQNIQQDAERAILACTTKRKRAAPPAHNPP